MAASVIAWKELNSNLSTESKAAPVYSHPLHGLLGSGIRLLMVDSNRTTPWRPEGPLLTVPLTQISGKIHTEGTRTQRRPGLLQLPQSKLQNGVREISYGHLNPIFSTFTVDQGSFSTWLEHSIWMNFIFQSLKVNLFKNSLVLWFQISFKQRFGGKNTAKHQPLTVCYSPIKVEKNDHVIATSLGSCFCTLPG